MDFFFSRNLLKVGYFPRWNCFLMPSAKSIIIWGTRDEFHLILRYMRQIFKKKGLYDLWLWGSIDEIPRIGLVFLAYLFIRYILSCLISTLVRNTLLLSGFHRLTRWRGGEYLPISIAGKMFLHQILATSLHTCDDTCSEKKILSPYFAKLVFLADVEVFYSGSIRVSIWNRHWHCISLRNWISV